MNANNSSEISFLDFHQPTLKSDVYTIKVTQTIQVAGETKGPWQVRKKIAVAGERFELPPQSIYARFPPAGNVGDHANVLPHITLNRSTLPWERYASKDDPELPWLWLFVFDEDDLASGRVKTLEHQPINDFYEVSSANQEFSLKEENGDPTHVNVLCIQQAWAKDFNVIPDGRALKLMGHVRRTEDGEEVERAACIANRLPAPGKKSFAHLLSLEGRFKTVTSDDGKQSVFNEPDSTMEEGYYSFISLANWSFFCPEQDRGTDGTFKGLIDALDSGAFKLSGISNDIPALSKEYLDRGSVVLPHRLRTGGTAISWYQGPFVPGAITNATMSKVVGTSDQLLRFEDKLAMLDASYACAWELGRLLTLNNKPIAKQIAAWKKQCKWAGQPHASWSHLPFDQGRAKVDANSNAQSEVEKWFSGLSLLEGVPFDYLVPDPQLLPEESIRFFRLDNHWISCLLNGAFSIGSLGSDDPGRERCPYYPKERTVTGVLLRSDAVSGWPGLKVSGSSSDNLNDDKSYENESILKTLRVEKLGPDVLLCFFEGTLATLDVHLPAENLHFGFDRPYGNQSNYWKNLRNPEKGGLIHPAKAQSVQWLGHTENATATRFVDMHAISEQMRTKLEVKSSKWSPAQLALQMIEGVPRVRFSVVR